ncbi:unnamed protein product [Vicia faba]|uniref:Thioredoxin domain-containing protein n=1 Tax=Vicia faba TaxID=3906 RepID=A0AAV0YBK6_VICFA|nr:unnamed protein product [Vicia faba]
MAVSISTSSITLSSLNSCTRVGASSSSSSPQLQFPVRTRFLPIGTRRRPAFSRPRFLVQAKKQTFSSFDDLLANSDKPVFVDFYATWCGPCQFMVPVLEEVSTRLNDLIQVVKIDTEKYPSIANKYKIEALPTFIIFKDGEPFDRFEGALTADKLIERIETSLKVKQ